ncbi:MAG: hypothetical protein KAR79_01550, partial [Simkaniaceae bacterium]|nr:hypothetical protein [Simkaniaceae bacterium]
MRHINSKFQNVFSQIPMRSGLFLLAFQTSVYSENTLNDRALEITQQEEVSEELLTLAAPIEESFTLTPMNDEEAFFVRRITEFWKDGDFSLVQSQIQEFFEKYPTSALHDYFQGILGDLHLQYNSFDKALAAYEKVYDPEVLDQIILNKLQCYYELSEYEKLSEEGFLYLSSTSDEILSRQDELYFLLGEALFRQASTVEEISLKKELASQAKSFYEKLEATPYETLSLFALAEVYSLLNEHTKATDYFLRLSKQFPDMSEDFLFQAASHQSFIDNKRSIELFNQVLSLNGDKSPDASFNLVVLLFQNESYKEIVANHKKLSMNLSKEVLPNYYFILGKSYFSLEENKDSAVELQKYIDEQITPTPQLKHALLLQMSNADIISDIELYSASYNQFEDLFPEDNELPKAQFLHAMLDKKLGNANEAFEKLRCLHKNFPAFATDEKVNFEYCHLAHECEKWELSYILFDTFLSQYPESINKSSAEKYFFSAALNLLKSSEDLENPIYSKPEFYRDLQSALALETIFTQNELHEYTLLAAKIAYELTELSDTRYYLDEYLAKEHLSNDPGALAEANYLRALSTEKDPNTLQNYCTYLEKAQKLNKERFQTPGIHLQLYNAYISLAGLVDTDGNLPSFSTEQKEMFVENAAEHLYAASQDQDFILRPENNLWLANHFYNKTKNPDSRGNVEELQRKSVKLFANALTFSNGADLVLIDKENLSYEGEVLKLATLLGVQGNHREKLALLEELIEQQGASPDYAWKFHKQALFELANSYCYLGNKEKALDTYTFLSHSSSNIPTTLESFASYHSAKLRYMLLDESLKTENNELVSSILSNYKELQIRKNIQADPIHLESALEYATVRSEICDLAKKNDRYLFFLGRIKEDYTNEQDPHTEQYLSSLQTSKGSQKTYDSYMLYIEAEMLRINAKQM